MNEGNRVVLLRDIKGGWGSSPVKAGSRGVIVKASMWSSTHSDTFTDQGWTDRSFTVNGVKERDLRRA